MTRIRISTTVDGKSLAEARALGLGSDSVMLDAALTSLIARHRDAEIDRAYAAYDDQPIDEPDEWGDLAAFRVSVGSINQAAATTLGAAPIKPPRRRPARRAS